LNELVESLSRYDFSRRRQLLQTVNVERTHIRDTPNIRAPPHTRSQLNSNEHENWRNFKTVTEVEASSNSKRGNNKRGPAYAHFLLHDSATPAQKKLKLIESASNAKKRNHTRLGTAFTDRTNQTQMLHLHPHRHSHPGVAQALGVARSRTATQGVTGRRLVDNEKEEFVEPDHSTPVYRDGSRRQLLEYIENGVPNGDSSAPPPPIIRISEPLLGRENVAAAAAPLSGSCKSEVSLITVAWADEFYSKKLDPMLDSWCGPKVQCNGILVCL
jgi:hypothetical protein